MEFFLFNLMFYFSIMKFGTSGSWYKWVLKYANWWAASITIEYIFDIAMSRRKGAAIFGAIVWPFAYYKYWMKKDRMIAYINGDILDEVFVDEETDDTVFVESISDEIAALI